MPGTEIKNGVSPFGKYLKNKLMEINKTQRWLSKQVKIDPATISYLVVC
jgi:plasmid maintenance system antidote protein VapI